MRSLLALLAALTATVLVACGGGETGSSNAAGLAPAGSAVYAEFTMKPEGEQKQQLEAILAKFPGGADATRRIEDLIEKSLAESDAPISYSDDVKPWLGDAGAFFVERIAPDGGDGAVLIATEDEDAARDALEKALGKKSEEKSHNDVDYLADPDGKAAAAVVDGFVVIGTERALKVAIDTAAGGEALEDDDAYDKAISEVAEERLALIYVNSPKLYELARQNTQGMPLPDSFKDIFSEPYVATVDVEDDGVLVEANTPRSLSKSVPFFGAGSDLVEEMPADSWLAVAQPKFGDLADYYLDAFGVMAGGREQIEQQFEIASGLKLQEDVLSWMEDFAVFVRGTSVAELDGALVVETSDPQATARFIERLRRLAALQNEPGTRVGPLTAEGGGEGFTVRSAGLPKPIHVLVRDDRFVVAFGDDAAKAAVDPGEKLGDSPEFTAAAESLEGYDVSFFMAMEPIFQLVESTPVGADPGYQQAKPYLEPLSALVGGAAGDSDDLRMAYMLVLR